MNQHQYLIGLGSNRRHPEYGAPRAVIHAALADIEGTDVEIVSVSSIMCSRPLGPSRREYANAGAWLRSDLPPDRLLARLKSLEQEFGRQNRGQKWRSRVLDLDIILWSGGIWQSESPPLTIPHDQAYFRPFVLQPLCQIAPEWRDPVSGKTLKQIFKQLLRPKRLDP